MAPPKAVFKEIHTFDDLPEICLIEEVMQFFRVERPQVLDWCRNKNKLNYFPNAFKVAGNRWRIPRSDVLELTQRLYGNGTQTREN